VNSNVDSKAVLIAGPTASGKSALALELAQTTGGVVINADSMQVYRDCASHGAADTRGGSVPHPSMAMSMPRVNFSAALGGRCGKAGRRCARKTLPIFVGGSGCISRR
jgi:tRNA dimethylallyltransferase